MRFGCRQIIIIQSRNNKMRKEIEIPNLPEGYKAIAFRIGRKGETK